MTTPPPSLSSPSTATALPLVQRIGNAVDGATYRVPVAASNVIVDELRVALEKLSGIPGLDQILLCGPPFARLDPRKPLEHYGLPSEDKRVFLYDRRMLSQDKPTVARPAIAAITEIELPTAPISSSESSRLLSESGHPIQKALAEYESHFQQNVHESEALEKATEANIAASATCVAELQVQSDAIDAAVDNLDIFKASMTKHFTPFWTEFEDSSVRHEELLRNFDEYLSRLSNVELHPVLATDQRKTLFDCIPADREREWAKQCEQSHAHVRAQVVRLRALHDEICQDVQDIAESNKQVAEKYAEAQSELAQMQQQASAQASITAKLRTNLDFVTKRVAATTAEVSTLSVMRASTAVIQVCREVDDLYQQQADLVPNAKQIFTDVGSSVERFSEWKDIFTGLVHNYLKRISLTQSKIRDFENSLSMLKEAHGVQTKQFDELNHIEMLPESYFACLKEISRRGKYGKMFSERIQAMAEELAQLREEEVQHREAFLRNFGQHLPRDFVSGLAEKPSHCEFRMRPFDQGLPHIELKAENDANSRVGAPSLDGGMSSETASEDGKSVADAAASESAEQESLSMTEGQGMDSAALQLKCRELEARVAELTAELQSCKKESSYFSESSIARSDISKASAHEGDSSCEFPLMLALAATAGGMTSSSEAERSNLLERELVPAKHVKELEKQVREKDLLISKLESENQQFLLNAAAFEEYPLHMHCALTSTEQLSADVSLTDDSSTDIQARSTREAELQEKQSSLHRSVQSLQFSIGLQRTYLVKVLQLLELPVDDDNENIDGEESMLACMNLIESRIRELLASADAAKVLRDELERRQDELSLVQSTDLAEEDSFKISFRSFDVGDLALFLPTHAPGSESQRVYLAFHLGCPHRFLSEESISSFSVSGKRFPDYVVGRIIIIDEQVATDSNNPYALPLNTTFYVLTVASLYES